MESTPVQKHGRRFDDKENESVRSCVVLANLHAVEQTRLRDAIASMELELPHRFYRRPIGTMKVCSWSPCPLCP